jgi:hypothetical protein
MFNSRRVPRNNEPSFDQPNESLDTWGNDDPMADLVRLVEADIESVTRRPLTTDELADAMMAEMDAPFGKSGAAYAHGEPGRPMQATVYDAWDDEAMASLPDDFQFDNSPPESYTNAYHARQAAELAPEPRARKRFGLIAAAFGAFVIVVAGFVGWQLIAGDSGFNGPSLVLAPTGPYKVVPDAGDSIEEPVDGQAVFGLDGTTVPKGEERLQARDESVPDLPPVTPQVSRVILPDGQEVASEPVDPALSGPRRVRTVLVKPDGTIIESPDGPPPSLSAEARRLETTLPGASGAVAEASTEADDGSAAGLPPIDETMVVDTTTTASAADGSALPDLPGMQEIEVASADQTATLSGLVDAPAPRARPSPATSASAEGPLDLGASANTAAVPEQQVASLEPVAPAAAALAPAGSAFVQIASQKSEGDALATFTALQRKYPGVLSGLSPDIQRADLGAKGIFYRIRVAAASRDEAISLCESLKAAGSDCLIARN